MGPTGKMGLQGSRTNSSRWALVGTGSAKYLNPFMAGR
jgi:hypothetical protein